ncbi:hypothetical protein [Mariniluteicoccus endophyticus]
MGPSGQRPMMGPGGTQGPVPPAPPTNPGKQKKVLFGVLAGVLVLVLGLGAFLLWNGHQKEQAARRAEEARIAEENRQKGLAGDAVKFFYDKLAAGDAEAVKGMAQTPPTGKADLLTNEVLAEAMKKAPIKDVSVSVSSVAGTRAYVNATYTIGDKTLQKPHELTRTDDVWKLTDIAADVSLGVSGPKRSVNGKEVDAGRYLMFPGGYTVTTSNPMLVVTNGDFVVTDLQGTTGQRKSIDFEVSEAGRNASMEAARKALNDCVGKSELAPAGCPMIRWKADADVKVSSMRYTVKGDPFAGVTPTCTASTLSCRVSYSVSINANGRGTSPRGSLTLSGDQTSFVIAKVALDTGTPVVTMS